MKRQLRYLGLLLGTLVLAQPTMALAQQSGVEQTRQKRDDGAKRVNLELMVVHANHGQMIDPELEPIMKQLRFLKFSGFKLLAKYPTQLVVGKEATFQLVNNRKLRVQLISRDEKAAKIRIRMFSGSDKVVDTTVSIHRNRSFIVAGPKYKDGVLVLPVSVRY